MNVIKGEGFWGRLALAIAVFCIAVGGAVLLVRYELHRVVRREVQAPLETTRHYIDALGFNVFQATLAQGNNPHSVVRLFAIRSQAQLIDRGSVVLLGDSRIEATYIPTLCGAPVLNAGVGGVGVAYFSAHAPEILDAAHSKLAVLAVGINDAMTSMSSTAPDYLNRWVEQYTSVMESARARNIPVVIVPILPFEKGKPPLGAGLFDQDVIDALNAALLQISRKFNAPVVDPLVFKKLYAEGGKDALTFDGVHFTAQGNRALRASIEQTLRRHSAALGIGCG